MFAIKFSIPIISCPFFPQAMTIANQPNNGVYNTDRSIKCLLDRKEFVALILFSFLRGEEGLKTILDIFLGCGALLDQIPLSRNIYRESNHGGDS